MAREPSRDFCAEYVPEHAAAAIASPSWYGSRGQRGLVVFAMIGEAAFGHIEPFATLVLALVGWAVTSIALYGLLAFLRPESCGRTKD
jgi:hypothetical protein